MAVVILGWNIHLAWVIIGCIVAYLYVASMVASIVHSQGGAMVVRQGNDTKFTRWCLVVFLWPVGLPVLWAMQTGWATGSAASKSAGTVVEHGHKRLADLRAKREGALEEAKAPCPECGHVVVIEGVRRV